MSAVDSPVKPAPGGSPEPSPKKRRGLKVVLIALAVLLVGTASAGAIYAYTINRSVSQNIQRADTLPTDGTGGTTTGQPTVTETGTLDYVLLGSDSRNTDPGDGRSDSIMVVHLDKNRDKATIVSFPRDMYVDIPGYGMNKINAAYSFGGAKLTVETLQNLLGYKMDHVVLIDFQGFIALTKDLGGVTVKNKTAFTSHGYSYPKGNITISGQKALWFVRERHALPGGDLDRAANQRNVIKAIVAKGLSVDNVADPVKFTAFLSNVAKNITVDQTLTDADIRNTALSLRLDASDIELLQAPLAGFETVNGQDVDVVDKTKLAELAKALRTDTVDTYLKKYPKG
ncbi:LCP family protein [Microlunatus ginsengisoli]|uniref:LCP family protein n=1 Tax=Microlunatus ginsengisoli TaxID=363863 RepID=A0ABP7A0S9_9ACTN